MANYVEYIKVGPGESWPVRDKEAWDKLNDLVDLVYPVGSIYMSMNGSVSPDSLFGGTWERIQDRFLLAAGDNYGAGTTGGEAAHVLTTAEMPSHTHTELIRVVGHSGWEEYTSPASYGIMLDVNKFTSDDAIVYNDGNKTYNSTTVGARTNTTSSGNDNAHNNMPPYLAVYMWRRIS